MKNRILKTLLIVALLNIYSCSEKIDTESYYLKKPFIKQEKIKFKSNLEKEQYWKISRSNDGYIITERKNSKNEFIDRITEKITEKGSELVSYEFSIKTDSVRKKIKFYPKEKDLILWDLKESSEYEGEIIIDGIIYEIKRKRKFVERINQDIIFLDSLSFKPISTFPNKKDWYLEKNFTQKTFMRKNKGLVKFERNYNGQQTEIFNRIEN